MPLRSFVDSAENYTNTTWVNNAAGVAGNWKIFKPSGTITEISNSNQDGRFSIGDKAFFILASGIQKNVCQVQYIFDEDFIVTGQGESLGVVANYNWFGGLRKISFSNYNHYSVFNSSLTIDIFNISHSGDNSLDLKLDMGTQGELLIDQNAWRKSYTFNLFLLNKNNNIYNYNFSTYKNDDIAPLFVTDIFSPHPINALTFLASGSNSDNLASNQRNYGLFFNDIYVQKEQWDSVLPPLIPPLAPASVPSSSSLSLSSSSLSSPVLLSSSSLSSPVLLSSSSLSSEIIIFHLNSDPEISSCSLTRNSLLNSTEVTDFHNAINAHFDTFKRQIVVHKEPKKDLLIDNQNGLFGYSNLSTEEVNYIPEYKCFPAIIKYDPSNKDLEGILDINTLKYKQIVKIKVKEDARNYILDRKTEKITFDGKDFNLISDDIPKNYQGLKYYCFYMHLIS